MTPEEYGKQRRYVEKYTQLVVWLNENISAIDYAGHTTCKTLTAFCSVSKDRKDRICAFISSVLDEEKQEYHEEFNRATAKIGGDA